MALVSSIIVFVNLHSTRFLWPCTLCLVSIAVSSTWFHLSLLFYDNNTKLYLGNSMFLAAKVLLLIFAVLQIYDSVGVLAPFQGNFSSVLVGFCEPELPSVHKAYNLKSVLPDFSSSTT